MNEIGGDILYILVGLRFYHNLSSIVVYGVLVNLTILLLYIYEGGIERSYFAKEAVGSDMVSLQFFYGKKKFYPVCLLSCVSHVKGTYLESSLLLVIYKKYTI